MWRHWHWWHARFAPGAGGERTEHGVEGDRESKEHDEKDGEDPSRATLHRDTKELEATEEGSDERGEHRNELNDHEGGDVASTERGLAGILVGLAKGLQVE